MKNSGTSPTTESSQEAIQIQTDVSAAEKKLGLERQEEELELEQASKKFYTLT